MPDLDAPGGLQDTRAVGRRVARAHLGGLDRAVRGEVAAGDEARLQARFRTLAQSGLRVGLDPSSPDALNFTNESQPLVDAAFLGQALLRAPHTLRDGLDASTRARLVDALASTRQISPGFNNWLLFSATVEAGLASLGAPWDRVRVDYALRAMALIWANSIGFSPPRHGCQRSGFCERNHTKTQNAATKSISGVISPRRA